MSNKFNNQKKGFTLLETVLVMFIVAVSFTGIYVVMAKNSEHEKDNRYSLIAANLAQEGVEIIRNIRDNNLLAGSNLNSGLPFNGSCRPHWNDSSLVSSCGISLDKKIQLENGIYRNCSNANCPQTKPAFSRNCQINSNSTQIVATCTVTWQSPSLGVDKEVKIKAYLTNWQAN